MSITACLLLLGSCGSASRTIEVEPSIERIVVGLVIGGVRDVLGRDSSQQAGGIWRIPGSAEWPTLRIDGEARTGWQAWTVGACKVARYVCDSSDSGSVEYSYRLRLRGLDIRRTTRIEDGRVSLVTDVCGRLGPRGELHHVVLSIEAVEFQSRTRITGSIRGSSEIGNRCRLVNRIASREISRGLADALREIERGGIDLYRSADDVIEALTRRGR